MNKLLLLVLLTILFHPHATRAAPAQVPFDRAYTVASPGSTTPVTEFDLAGPAPVLYLDLPSPLGQYSYSSSSWFSGPASTAAFTLSGGDLFTSEGEFWLSPSPEAWEQAKATGEWHINASYSWWTLYMTYGVGAPLTNAAGSQTVTFSVTDAAYRIPGDADGDDRITIIDYFRLTVGYSGRMTGWANGDFDRNGAIDVNDFAIIDRAFLSSVNGGLQVAAGLSVPEPGALAALLSIAVLLRRKHPSYSPRWPA